jgi:hypothetical protein
MSTAEVIQFEESESQEISLTKMYEIAVESLSPVGFGRYYEREYPATPVEQNNKETYEERTWMKRLWINEDGKVFIPGVSFKGAYVNAAGQNMLPDRVPNTGNKGTYTKHFAAGFHVINNVVTEYTEADVVRNKWGKWLHVPANAQRGGKTRVMRCFPTIPKWAGKLQVITHDPCLTKDILKRFGDAAGLVIGVGSLRVQNNGMWGQFRVVSVEEKAF